MPAEPRHSPLAEYRLQLEQMATQFAAALPDHIPVERFSRVVLTALQNSPRLLECSRHSFWQACMRAAQDGLLPDGREGAIVAYKSEAQWMPMVAGIRKKARNSGEISDWWSAVVYERDHFVFQLGDQPFIDHKPFLSADDPGPIIAAYSVARLRDGTISRDVMSRRDIDRRRAMSRASREDSPWNTWLDEMCQKTVVRHHAKSLPTATDIEEMFRREEEAWQEAEPEAPRPRPKLHSLLDSVAAGGRPSAQSAPVPPGAGVEGAGSAPHLPADPAPETEPRERLLEELGKAAKGGRESFNLAWRNLHHDDRALLTDADRKTLSAAAEQADYAKAKGGDAP